MTAPGSIVDSEERGQTAERVQVDVAEHGPQLRCRAVAGFEHSLEVRAADRRLAGVRDG